MKYANPHKRYAKTLNKMPRYAMQLELNPLDTWRIWSLLEFVYGWGCKGIES